MELDNKIDELFDNVKNAKKDKLYDTANKDLKRIETQLNNYLKDKKGKKYERVSVFSYNERMNYDSTKFSEKVDNEILNKFSNKKWGSIPLYLKWKIVQEYLTEKDINDNDIIEKIKQHLSKKTDIFSYDHINNKLINITLDEKHF